MLRPLSELEGYTIGATDDTIGRVTDLYFDDRVWTLRYFVVETGKWLASRKVLISPFSIGAPDRSDMILPASISRDQVRNSPDMDTDRPVSRQQEEQFLGYYGYPNYWIGGGLWGPLAYPGGMVGGKVMGPPDQQEAQAQAERHQHDDHHLRSANTVRKYRIRATDGDIGHVQDMLVEDGTWAIRYLVVNTGHWWHGTCGPGLTTRAKVIGATTTNSGTAERHSSRRGRACSHAPGDLGHRNGVPRFAHSDGGTGSFTISTRKGPD